MIRLSQPTVTTQELFKECVNGIHNKNLREYYLSHLTDLVKMGELYVDHSKAGQLYKLPKIDNGRKVASNNIKPDPIVVGTLNASHLKKLYSEHMVPQTKPARYYYDKIMISAQDKCPFCGGVGTPSTLDHYLPKGRFPQYSVLPVNLVPSCKDCNTGKGVSISQTPETQVLHPYLDGDHFFNEQWMFASVLKIEPVVMDFFVCPPKHWTEIDQLRVTNHLKDFDLSKRFGTQAANEVSILTDLRSGSLSEFSPKQFSGFLLEIASNASFKQNHWKKVMYHALSESKWYCSLRL